MNLKIALPNGRVAIASNTFEGDNPIGYRVLISTPTSGTTGIVIGLSNKEATVESIEFVDKYPVTTLPHIQAVLDTSISYGLIPWIFLFELLPSVFYWKKETYVKPLKKSDSTLDKQSAKLLAYLFKRKEVKEEVLKKRFGKDLVELLKRKGFLTSFSKWDMPNLEVQTFRMVVSFTEAVERIKRFKNKQKKLELITYLSERLYCTLEELKAEGFSSKDIRDLLALGIIQKQKEYVYGLKSAPPTLKQERKRPIKKLEKSTVVWGLRRHLLDRLLEILELSLESGKTSLIFVSSLSNLLALEDILIPTFGDKVLTISSKESAKELVKNWFLSLESPRIVVGTNLVALAPVENVENVIVFDDWGSKLHNGVDLKNYFYLLSKYLGAKFILFSPCLDTHSYKAIKEGLFNQEGLPYTPQVEIIQREPKEILNPRVLELLRDSSKKTLLLVNKVGYAYAYCPSCQDLLLCPICSSILTLTSDKRKVFCRCGFKSDAVCPTHEVQLQPWGFGIEKVIQELESTLENRDHIHYATQPNLSQSYDYTVVVNADNILSVPFFDSQERYFKYLWTALSITNEKLIIQTLQPQLPVIESILKNDPFGFLEEELEERKRENLPPYTKVVHFSYKYVKEKSLLQIKQICSEFRLVKRQSLTEVFCKVDGKNLPQVLKVLRSHKPFRISVF